MRRRHCTSMVRRIDKETLQSAFLFSKSVGSVTVIHPKHCCWRIAIVSSQLAESDSAQKEKWMVKARQSEFAASASWLSRRHTNEGVIVELSKYDAEPLAMFLMQSRCYGLNGQGSEDPKFRRPLIGLLGHERVAEFQSLAAQNMIEAYDRLKVQSVVHDAVRFVLDSDGIGTSPVDGY